MTTMCLMPSRSSPWCAAAGPAPRATPRVRTAPITADRRGKWIPGLTATSEGMVTDPLDRSGRAAAASLPQMNSFRRYGVPVAGRTSSVSRRRGRRPAARGGGPLDLLGRVLTLLWMGLAHGVGWLVRAVGRRAADARELDPEHRRDGAGLLVRGIAVLLACGGGLLAQAVTPWVAVPLLVLVALFGVLVVTATPINRIPQRLAQVRDMALGRVGAESTVDDAEEVEEEEAPVRVRRGPARRRQA